MDLDDVPVTGAPHKDFETLLQEQLAKEGGGGMGGGAEPAKNAKTPPGATPRSASARKFLRKGARNERTTLTPTRDQSVPPHAQALQNDGWLQGGCVPYIEDDRLRLRRLGTHRGC
jgi:hypothetical protein